MVTCAAHVALVMIGACYSGSTLEGVADSAQLTAIGWYAGTSLAGRPIDGFALSLTPSRYRVPIDGQIEFAFEVRNTSAQARSAPVTGRGSQYWMALTNRKTGNGAVLGFRLQNGAASDYSFAPGTSQYVWLTSNLMRYFPEPGTYSVEIVAGSHPTARESGSLRSNVLLITILPRTDGMPTFAQNDPSASGPTGVPQGGVALALQPARHTYHVGEPIWIVIELRDVAGRLRSGTRYILPNDLDFSVVNQATGARVPRNAAAASDLSGISSPGGAFILTAFSSSFSAVRLNPLYQLNEPGTYSVRLDGLHVRSNDAGGFPVTLSSNAIEIRVTP